MPMMTTTRTTGTRMMVELRPSSSRGWEPKGQKKGKAPEKVVHPYSRKAAYLAREEIRLNKKERQKNEKATRLTSVGEKLLWFQGQLEADKTIYSKKDACDIIEKYLHRFDSELEQIELVNGIKGRQGRLHGARETVIKQTIERERALYEGNGFEIPDIINAKQLKTFREWTGDLKKLPNIKLRLLSNKGLDKMKEEDEEKAEDGEEDDKQDEEEEEKDDADDLLNPPKGQKKGKAPEKVVHPYSRKAAYLAREEIRLNKKERQKNEKATRLTSVGEKLLWFQGQLEADKTIYSKKDACDIIEKYLHRFDSELEQIELVNGIKGRQGRLHGARETVIKQTIERERALYEGNGFEIPDIINAKQLKTFREWTGDLKKLPNIKLRLLSNKGLDKMKEEDEEKAEDGEEDDKQDEEEEEKDDADD
ncbi:hypothetical protein CRUP_003118, partial [Coryphaenoides rupestris]